MGRRRAKWDRDATTPLPAGSFVVHHAGHVHYDGAKDKEVIVQITGIGPSGLVRIDRERAAEALTGRA